MGDQIKAIQTNFTSGELDPKLGLSRIDVKQYYNGAHYARNVVVNPQGGLKRRPGGRLIGQLGTDLTKVKFKDFAFSNTQHYMMLLRKDPTVPVTPTTAYANAGGTGDRTASITVTGNFTPTAGTFANLVDGAIVANSTDSMDPPATVAAPPYIRFDFGSGVKKYIDEITMKASTATIANVSFTIQGSNDAAIWTDLATTVVWNSATKVQALTGLSINGYRYYQLKWAPSGSIFGAGWMEEFEFKIAAGAAVPATQLDVYKGGVLQVSVAVANIVETQIPEVTFLQSLDTLLIFHPDVQTQKLVRGGSDVSWTLSNVTFLNTPSDPFEIVTTVTVDPAAVTGLAQVFTASGAFFAAGDVGKTIRGNGGVAKIITFTDTTHVVADIKKDFLNVNPPIPAGEWTLEEPAWSATRGWPSCGTFHQGRLYLAGSRQRPQSVWASRGGGLYFDFNDARSDLADYGFNVVGDSDTVSAVQNLYSGRYLSSHADDSEWYFPQSATEPITPSNVFLKRATKRGSLSADSDGNKIRVPLCEVDGGVLFVQKGGKSVRELLWDVDVADYTAQNIALLSPQLLNAPVDFALRKATSTDDSDLVIATNGDGTMAVLCTLRDQNITAWTGWSTEGDYIACQVDQSDIYAVVERTLNGTTAWYLEIFDDDCIFDCSTLVTTGFALTVSTPSYLDGVTLKVRIDDANVADCVPVAGVLTLPSLPTTSLEYGLNFPTVNIRRFGNSATQTEDVQTPAILLMPVAADLANGPIAAKFKRVVNVYAQFIDTQSAAIQGENCNFRQFDVDTFDTAPPLFTGHYPLEGLLGYDRYGETLINQIEPGPFNLASVIREVAF